MNHENLEITNAIKTLVGKSIREVEMMLINATLETVGGNRVRASHILKVTDRTLRNKLNVKKERKEAVSFNQEIQPNIETQKTKNLDHNF